jgi:hypothetical protein
MSKDLLCIGREGFAGLRSHEIRASYETLLLDARAPVHVFAGCHGHDRGASELCETYQEGGTLASGWLSCVTGRLGPKLGPKTTVKRRARLSRDH